MKNGEIVKSVATGMKYHVDNTDVYEEGRGGYGGMIISPVDKRGIRPGHETYVPPSLLCRYVPCPPDPEQGDRYKSNHRAPVPDVTVTAVDNGYVAFRGYNQTLSKGYIVSMTQFLDVYERVNLSDHV